MAFAGPLGIAAPVPVGTMVMVPLIMCGGTMPDGIWPMVPDGIATIELGCIELAAGMGFIEVEDMTGNSLDGLKPLQRPPLQMLYAH